MRKPISLFDRREVLAVATGILATLYAQKASAAPPKRQTKEFVIGSTVVKLQIYDFGPGPTYFAPHSDETTCVQAALKVLPAHGGRLVEVVTEKRRRDISFSLGDKRLAVDPNRIYTDLGIAKTLRRHGRYSREAYEAVQALATSIEREVWKGDPKLLVALHNNGRSSYSVRSYILDPTHIPASSRYHADMRHDPGDFFFVTTDEWFNALVQKSFNVVLQSKTPPDDGSMSVLCGKYNVPYINIEAWLGDSPETRASQAIVQSSMIEAVLSHWKSA